MQGGNINGDQQPSGGPEYVVGVTDPSESYSPSAVQSDIRTFLKEIKNQKDSPGVMTDYESFYVMYLMQEYGAQVTGIDAQTQNTMNGYFSKIQNLWNDLDGSNTGPGGADKTADFNKQLAAIENQLKTDPYFNGPNASPGAKNMLASIESTLSGISGTVSSNGGLNALWNNYNSGTGETGQGQAGPMSDLMRSLGQINQQFTGESQAVAADTKADTQLWQTEQDVFNSWGKALNKCVNYMAQLQRTS
jgi:hypothetical protein